MHAFKGLQCANHKLLDLVEWMSYKLASVRSAPSINEAPLSLIESSQMNYPCMVPPRGIPENIVEKELKAVLNVELFILSAHS